MKLQKIVSRFLKLHKKEIDLSLDRINQLCEKLGNPQDKIRAISVVGTNGKNSTIQACFSILKEANIKCNGMWILKNKFGLTWTAKHIRVSYTKVENKE